MTYAKSDGGELVLRAYGQREKALLRGLRRVEQQVLGVEASTEEENAVSSTVPGPHPLSPKNPPDDARRVAQRRARIALRAQHQRLHVEKLPQPRLPPRVGVVAAGRADEAHVGHAGAPARAHQLDDDVELVPVRRRHQADGIAARRRERLRHVALPAGLVRHDPSAELGQLSGLGRGRVHGQAGDGVDLGREVGVGEDEFGDEEAGLAVDGGDADVAGHLDGVGLVERMERDGLRGFGSSGMPVGSDEESENEAGFWNGARSRYVAMPSSAVLCCGFARVA